MWTQVVDGVNGHILNSLHNLYCLELLPLDCNVAAHDLHGRASKNHL